MRNIFFLEKAINAIVWSYASIEAFANNLIVKFGPQVDMEIDKNVDLASKLTVTLPALMNKDAMSQRLVDKFYWMDEIRHRIIHTQTKGYWYDGESWATAITSELLNGKFRGCAENAHLIIGHFKPEGGGGEIRLEGVVRGLGSRPAKK